MSGAGSRDGHGDRMGMLDAGRGLAVLLVLGQHTVELAYPSVAHAVSGRVVQVGQAGVMLFFLCSGFIIPTSLERLGNVRRFWVRRFFRLYPLYWLSLVLALLLMLVGLYPEGRSLSPAQWLANVTMVQGLFGLPDAIGLYWSLAWEMVFYLVMTAVFCVGLNRRSTELSVLVSVAVAAASVVARTSGHAGLMPVGAVSFVLMFLGTVWFRWYAGEVGGRAVASVTAVALVASGVVGVSLLGDVDPTGTGALARVPMVMAWWLSIVLFAGAIVLARRGSSGPRGLRHIGRISYSVYLLQALVLSALPMELAPSAVRVLVWVTTVLAVAELTFRTVERPAIAAGRSLSRRPHTSLGPVAAPVAGGAVAELGRVDRSGGACRRSEGS